MNDITETPSPSSEPISGIEINQKKFALSLHTMLKNWVEIHAQKPINIISIGCGDALEAKPLRDLFPHAYIRGVDRGDYEKAILDAAEQLAEFQAVAGPVEFINADATTSTAYEKEGNPLKYHLIIIRSPNVIKDPQNWNAIIKEAKTHLAPEGVLYITVQEEIERKDMENILTQNDFSYTTQENPHPQLESVHREDFLLIAHPKEFISPFE